MKLNSGRFGNSSVFCFFNKTLRYSFNFSGSVLIHYSHRRCLKPYYLLFKYRHTALLTSSVSNVQVPSLVSHRDDFIYQLYSAYGQLNACTLDGGWVNLCFHPCVFHGHFQFAYVKKWFTIVARWHVSSSLWAELITSKIAVRQLRAYDESLIPTLFTTVLN